MSEQAKLSQRLATEKVEDLEGRIQEIIEQERNRLARELHDSVSQQLFAASMMMSAINETKQQSEVENDREAKAIEISRRDDPPITVGNACSSFTFTTCCFKK